MLLIGQHIGEMKNLLLSIDAFQFFHQRLGIRLIAENMTDW